MREIVMDAETTGLDPTDGHRIVEIGGVELFNHVPTGRVYHQYINPKRDMPAEAFAVHGLSEERLSREPVFAAIAEAFLEFLGDARLLIHNAAFDMKFINAELHKVGHRPIGWANVVDTLGMARKKFPGSPASLDALCRRFSIDNTARTYHGALLDSELLAEVYLELLGGRQHGLGLAANAQKDEAATRKATKAKRKFREPRAHTATPEELAAHKELLEKIKDPIWEKVG